MKRNNDKKPWKRIFIVILVCVILFGSVASAIVLFHQGDAKINDYTETAEKPNEKDESDGSDDEPEAILSSNVKMMTGDDADKINNAIKTIQNTNKGLIMEIESDTQFEELGVGDIFYLEGSKETPFKETYIGKISSMDRGDGTATYIIETPTVDEVFDVLSFDYEKVLTAENISEIETVSGVTVKSNGKILTNTDREENRYTVSELSTTTESDENSAEWKNYEEDPQKLLFEYELDLFEVFGLDDEEDIEFQEKCNATEGNRVKVYTTTTGICYHRKTCPCVARSIYEMTLVEAELEGYGPCYLCNPPLLENKGVSNLEEELTLTGKMGLDGIDFSMDYDWDILNGNGLDELYIAAKGDFIIETELEAKLKYELEGRTTTLTLPFNAAEIQGLNEKLFPLVFITYDGKFNFSGPGNENIRKVTGSVPMSVGIIIYVDINGNVSIAGTVTFNYTQSFDYSNQVVKDGEWVLDQQVETEDETSLKLEVEAKADVDAHMGASLGLYVYNLNVVELALGKIGGSIEGTAKLNWSTNDEGETESLLDADYYMRLYLKILELDIKLKCNVNILGGKANIGADYTYIYADNTIAQWGAKRSTRYKEGMMSFSVLTAQDENAVYYKNEDNQLVREEDGFKEIIYDKNISLDKEFFSICGIDESFLYLTVPNDSGSYDIYRVAKDGSTSRKILSDVVNCHCLDETYIYYISNFDETCIYRINRETLKDEKFADFDENVKFMGAQDDDFYVVAQEDDIFTALFGGPSYCYLINSQGVVISEYGTDPEVQNYYLRRGDIFYVAIRQTSSGYLRSTAEEVCWMSGNKSNYVVTEEVSGWKYDDTGIFTTQENEEGSSMPYKIVLYRAADGSYTKVANVNSNQAFFTLCQSETEAWYFFDQTEEELILYRMNNDFSNKQVVKRFSLEELPCDLEKCSMTIMDNRIYFYAMTDDETSEMLYRYDVI